MNIININQLSTEFKMLGDNILVELKELATKKEEKTDSGIIIQTANQKSQITDRNTFGKVANVGPDITDIKVNDFVFWHITSGVEVQFRDGYFMVLHEDAILGCSK
jgi:co-chaperonin GroES (HSP10)